MIPIVSVVITSYNRVNSIEQSIQSVLSQVTNFDFEVIIVDDGSNDESQSVIEKYSCYNQVRIFLEDHKGLMPTYLKAFFKCKGKYVAVCDSDDYWIDPNKLQKQVDCMEENIMVAACFTRARGLKETGEFFDVELPPQQLSFNVMLKGGHMFSPTLMMRLDCLKYFWNTLENKRFKIWDYPLYLYISYYFKIAYLNDVTAVWRIREESYSNTRQRKRRLNYILILFRIKLYFILKYGCKLKTLLYVIGYRFPRDIYSLIFKRWYREN